MSFDGTASVPALEKRVSLEESRGRPYGKHRRPTEEAERKYRGAGGGVKGLAAVDARPESDSAPFLFIRDSAYASTIRINPPFTSPRGSRKLFPRLGEKDEETREARG